MTINIKAIKELRERTHVGLKAAKTALEQTDWDIDKAIKYLQAEGTIRMADSSEAGHNGFVAVYQHHNGKIGSMVTLLCETDFLAMSPSFQTLANEIAMHVAATNPAYTSPAWVPIGTKQYWEGIWEAQLAVAKKPEKIIPQIIEGKWVAWLKENCLTEQILASREDKTTITEAIGLLVIASGEKISVGSFSRLEID